MLKPDVLLLTQKLLKTHVCNKNCLSICFQFAVCCDELKIIPNISEINLFLGDTHVITCIGTAQKEVGFWLDPKEQQLDQSRGRVHMEKKGNLLLLVFKKIQAEDEGVWTCVSLNETSRIRFKLKLSESIHFENLTSLQTIVENKNEVVTCLVSGKPLPQVSWTFNGKHIICKYAM